MFWSAQREKRKQRNARIRKLEKVIANVWASDLGTDDDLAIQIGEEQTKHEQNELDSLNQTDLHESAQKWGIDIPMDFYEGEWPLKPTLSDAGVRWVTREISKARKQWAKDWVAIVLPIVSGLISILGLILGLVVAFRKR